MSEHTPGPWKFGRVVKPSNFGDLFISVTANDEVGPFRVAKVPGGNLNDRHVAEANARLIAAAPDLLACLRQLLKAGNLCIEDEIAVEAAIAKAEDKP